MEMELQVPVLRKLVSANVIKEIANTEMLEDYKWK